MFAPDYSSSDEEGLSDDNDYYEFKERIKKQQRTLNNTNTNSEADEKKKKLQLIMNAISFDKNEVIVNELDKGLEVDTDLEFGWTPLLLAASMSNENIILELLKRGANINQTQDSLTPLMLVCNNSSDDETVKTNITRCVKLLLDKGADVNTTDRKRRTAIMLAAYNGHLEAVKLLLPHVSKEAEDNQRWTALFWAVEGHRTETVEFLLKNDFNCDKIDIRGHTIADIAHSNGYEDILKLLPQEPLENDFYVHLSNNLINIENTFKDLNMDDKPQLFVDVCKILYGTKSESVVPIMHEQKVSLFNILSVSNSKLKDMGILLPYQRNRIMGGVFKFHKHPFQPKSIPFVQKGELYTNIDISSTVLSCVRQLIAMEASLKFMLENCERKLTPSEAKETEVLVLKNRRQINRLKVVSQQFVKQAQTWDSLLKPVDKITKKRWNIPWCNLCLSIGAISLSVFIMLRIK